MKRIILLSSLCAFFSCNFNRENSATAEILNFPSFDILLMDSTHLSTTQIPGGVPIIMVYFRPNCSHCQAETSLFLNNINKLRHVQFYMLTSASLQQIRHFYNTFHLEQFPNITVGNDYDHSFARLFKPYIVPYMAIYDKQKHLVKVYNGQIQLEKLLTTISM